MNSIQNKTAFLTFSSKLCVYRKLKTSLPLSSLCVLKTTSSFSNLRIQSAQFYIPLHLKVAKCPSFGKFQKQIAIVFAVVSLMLEMQTGGNCISEHPDCKISLVQMRKTPLEGCGRKAACCTLSSSTLLQIIINPLSCASFIP